MFSVLDIEPRASGTLSKGSTRELHPVPDCIPSHAPNSKHLGESFNTKLVDSSSSFGKNYIILIFRKIEACTSECVCVFNIILSVKQ